MIRQKEFPSFSPKAGGRSHDRRWFLHDNACYSYRCTPHNIDHKEDMHQKRYFPCHKEVFQNSIPGTAGGTRNVRIMTAPVPLRFHFFKAGGTDGNIGRCKNFIFAFPAGNGSKIGKRRKRSFFSLYALHKGRPFHLLKPAKESVYLFPCPGDVYFHFAAEVLYRACQFQFFAMRQTDGRKPTPCTLPATLSRSVTSCSIHASRKIISLKSL